MKKLLSVVFALTVFLFCLTSCKDDAAVTQTAAGTENATVTQTIAITEDNVKSVMADILPGASQAYNNILYGGYSAGEYDEADVKVENDCNYAPVADSKFDTMAKLKAEAEKYYTAAYAENNLYTVLNGSFPMYRELDGKLYINVDGDGGGGYTFLPDTATLVSSENDTFVVSVECMDNYDTKYTATLTFVAEDEQLKINAAEYK